MPQIIIKELHPNHYQRMLEIWRDSVKATHHFLSESYFSWLEKAVPGYFPAVHLTGAFVQGKNDDMPNVLAAFMGYCIDDEALRIEMLFVDPHFYRQGLGRMLIDTAKAMQPRVTLDVNEQNPGALAFYQQQGFAVTGRSELDSCGKPFPLLHMEYSAL